MRIPTIKTSAIGAWIMAIIYDKIATMTGLEIRIILYAAIVLLAVGLYASGRENKETTKGEA